MRLIPVLLATLLALPAAAQQTSPTTGTPASPPPSASPTGPAASPSVPAATPSTSSTPSARGPNRGRRGGQTRQTLQQRFDTANTTHDGKLTLEQAKAGRMNRVANRFDAIDTGKKGYVTMADITAYNRAQRAARTTQ